MNRRSFIKTAATLTWGFPFVVNGVQTSSQDFIWNEIVPIVKSFDPQYVSLIPSTWFTDRMPYQWKIKFDTGECKCIRDLNLPEKIEEAYFDIIGYTKVRGKYENTHRDWNDFKRNLFIPERKPIVWDLVISIFLRIKNRLGSLLMRIHLIKDGPIVKCGIIIK